MTYESLKMVVSVNPITGLFHFLRKRDVRYPHAVADPIRCQYQLSYTVSYHHHCVGLDIGVFQMALFTNTSQ
ncbi:Uncharacterised protein [Vibrio cholerae]|nr:Uncharacterised protein [Vibrio cholerae]